MSTISVSWQKASGLVDDFSSERRELSRHISSLRSVKSYSSLRGFGYQSIFNTLGRVIDSLDDDKDHIKNLENGLSYVLREYDTSEKRISENIKHDEHDWGKSIIKTIMDGIGKAGIAGSIISTVYRLITGDQTAADYLKAIKSLIPGLGGIATVISKGGAEWASRLIGWNATDVSKSFLENWKNQFPTNTTSATKTIGTIAKWAGHLLTVVANGAENAEEFKGTGNTGRAIGETVFESAVDIGVGTACTAVAATVIAALAGTATAPALLVAGTGAVLYTGANELCKWASGGRDLGEVIADGICDGIENIGNAVRTNFNAFCNWGKALFA